MNLILRAAAERDLSEAASWYEARRKGLGERFLHEVGLCFETIGEVPRAFGIVRKTARIRRCRVHGFPYAIYYWIERGEVVIVAVLHGARHPGALRMRK